MRSLTGLLLLIAGLGVGAHAYYPDTLERHVHIAQVARILTPSVSNRSYSEPSSSEAARSFSPGSQLITTGSIDAKRAVRVVQAPNAPILKSTPKLLRRTDPWDAKIVRTIEPGSYAQPLGRNQLSEADRWRLVRDVQSELRRVGCYFGKIDGSWGGGSKSALSEFLQAVNSVLPVNEPDYILLSLVRSQRDTVCGRTCRTGYTKSQQGTCLPNAVIAQRATSPDQRIVAPPARLVRTGSVESGISVIAPRDTSSVQRVAQQRRPEAFEGRMAVGGPPPGRIGARYSARGISAVPPLTSSNPTPVARARAVPRPSVKTKRASRSKATKTRRTARRYKSRRASSQRARRRALMRQAFGESFD